MFAVTPEVARSKVTTPVVADCVILEVEFEVSDVTATVSPVFALSNAACVNVFWVEMFDVISPRSVATLAEISPRSVDTFDDIYEFVFVIVVFTVEYADEEYVSMSVPFIFAKGVSIPPTLILS